MSRSKAFRVLFSVLIIGLMIMANSGLPLRAAHTRSEGAAQIQQTDVSQTEQTALAEAATGTESATAAEVFQKERDVTLAQAGKTKTTTGSRLTADQWNAELFRLTNLERSKAGCPVLMMGSSSLLQAAATRAKETSVSFSHYRPDGSPFLSVLTQYGITCSAAGENILRASAGSLSPTQVMQYWMNSAGHAANILNTTYTDLGIGYYRAGGYDYFVQLFIRTP